MCTGNTTTRDETTTTQVVNLESTTTYSLDNQTLSSEPLNDVTEPNDSIDRDVIIVVAAVAFFFLVIITTVFILCICFRRRAQHHSTGSSDRNGARRVSNGTVERKEDSWSLGSASVWSVTVMDTIKEEHEPSKASSNSSFRDDNKKRDDVTRKSTRSL